MTGPYWLHLLAADPLQHRDPAAAVVRARSGTNVLVLFDHLDRRQHRHVAGALRDRRHQPAPRLSAVSLGHVLPDHLGLGDVHRNDRTVLLS